MSAFTSEYVSLMIARNMFCMERIRKGVVLEGVCVNNNKPDYTGLTMRMKKMKKTKVVK